MATAYDVLLIAASEVGYVETPVNRTKFAAEAGHANGAPWCATFMVAVARRAGIKLPSESAYTPTMANGFKLVRRFFTNPQPGDLAFFDFPGDDKARVQHVGIVESATPGTVTCIEGNTSSGTAGSQDNGGGVYRRTRSRAHVVGFGRPAYAKEIRPMFDPALDLEPIVADLACPSGGAWLLAASGAVYTFGGAPFHGGANGKDYFTGRKAARLELNARGAYDILASSGERYSFPG